MLRLEAKRSQHPASHLQQAQWLRNVLADPPKPSGGIAPGAEQVWSAEELATFLTATADSIYSPVWEFLGATGCRRGEALGLRWRDVNLDAGTASIRQSVQKIAGLGVVVEGLKTDASKRTVALDAHLVAMLREHRKEQAERRLLVGPGWSDLDLVFAGPTGEPLHPESCSKAFRDAVDRMGLPAIPLHGLRHTHATLGMALGVPAKVMQTRLGHAHVSITLGIYSHDDDAMQGQAASLIGDTLSAARAKAVDGR